MANKYGALELTTLNRWIMKSLLWTIQLFLVVALPSAFGGTNLAYLFYEESVKLVVEKAGKHSRSSHEWILAPPKSFLRTDYCCRVDHIRWVISSNDGPLRNLENLFFTCAVQGEVVPKAFVKRSWLSFYVRAKSSFYIVKNHCTDVTTREAVHVEKSQSPRGRCTNARKRCAAMCKVKCSDEWSHLVLSIFWVYESLSRLKSF